jgi:hypothetical protein
MSKTQTASVYLLRLSFLLWFVLPVQAQESSPYSRYGIGFLSDMDYVTSRSMGGLGAAYRGPEGMNFANPASLSAVTLTSLEVGVSGYTMNRKTNFGSAAVGGADLQYVSLSFPIAKWWATGSGVMSYARQENFFSDTLDFNGNRGLIENESEGGLYNFFWGNAFRYKDISLGVNIAYLFGNISNSTVAFPLDNAGFPDVNSFTSWQGANLRVKSFFWNTGVQYHKRFRYGAEDNRKVLKFTAGVSGSPSYTLGGRTVRDESLYLVDSRNLTFKSEAQSYSDYFGDLLVNNPLDFDTVSIQIDLPTSITIPGYIQAGFTLADSTRWMVGFDARYQPWSQYQGYREGPENTFQNSWRVAFGGEFLPSIKTEAKIFAKLKYRAGFSYQRTNIQIANNPINEFGINVGFGIPMTRRIYDEFNTRLVIYAFHVGIEAGSRGTLANNLIRENFVRFRLGINFNDKWFMKRKYY